MKLVLDNADRHLQAGSFLTLPFGCETFSLSGSTATFAVIAGYFLADGALAKSDGLRDLALGLFGLFDIRDYYTIFRTDAGVFVINSQFVVEPDWTNPCLCLSNFYSLTI